MSAPALGHMHTRIKHSEAIIYMHSLTRAHTNTHITHNACSLPADPCTRQPYTRPHSTRHHVRVQRTVKFLCGDWKHMHMHRSAQTQTQPHTLLLTSRCPLYAAAIHTSSFHLPPCARANSSDEICPDPAAITHASVVLKSQPLASAHSSSSTEPLMVANRKSSAVQSQPFSRAHISVYKQTIT